MMCSLSSGLLFCRGEGDGGKRGTEEEGEPEEREGDGGSKRGRGGESERKVYRKGEREEEGGERK